MQITFRADDEGLTVVDPIERHHYSLTTPAPIEPTEAATGQFTVPVDVATQFTTEELVLPTVVAVYVRNEAREMLADIEQFGSASVPAGTYTIEICAPVKLYLKVRSAIEVSAGLDGMRIAFDDPTDVVVGARSYHEHPAATIVTPPDPESVMAAISTFGSALKTTSVERSYPTLRGHPPLVELGETLDIPDALPLPETCIRIELPADFDYVYPAASLAYYLGAEVVPGDTARLVTETGFEYDLDGPGTDYETAVSRVLKQVFFLDCLVRTEGYYTVPLHERDVLEGEIPLDFATVYDYSLAEQVEAYLDIPFETLEAHVPDWKLTTHVAPSAQSVESLPFLVDDLAVIRTPKARPEPTQSVEAGVVNDFLRSDDFTRSSAAESAEYSYVQPDAADSLEQAWVGDGTPIGASKSSLDAFMNRLDRSPVEGDIEITVVCNDARMDDERSVVDHVYGSRDRLPFDVSVHHDLEVEELERVLASQTDFLHYIGHIDAEGFECADGKLDAATLDEVGVDAFFLNACSSYEQGMALIDAGAIAGIVTHSDVINSGAIKIGRTVARLLNAGFPLQSALEVARGESIVGDQYLVVGDNGLAIAQAESGTPMVFHLEAHEEEEKLQLQIETYPTSERGMGSIIKPYLTDIDSFYLSAGELHSFEVSEEELLEFFSWEELPVCTPAGLRWSSQVIEEGL